MARRCVGLALSPFADPFFTDELAMIPHPHYLQDPRYFFSDLELLLRRYDVELHAAAIQTPAGPVAVMGFAGPRWVNACNSSTFNHKAARKFYEAYANPVVVAEREKTQRGKL